MFVTDKEVKGIKVGNKAVELAENNGLYEFSASDKEIDLSKVKFFVEWFVLTDGLFKYYKKLSILI